MSMLIALAMAGVMGQPTELRPFSFRQFNTDLTYADATRERLAVNCTDSKIDRIPLMVCSGGRPFWQGGVSGLDFYATQIAFDGEGAVFMSFAVISSGYSTLRDAFTARYGEPCGEDVSVVQNRMGAQFEKITVNWCFSDGQMDLSNISSNNLDRAQVTFAATRFIERDRPDPIVNF